MLKVKNIKEHETKRNTLWRFLIALSILIMYIIYLVFKFGPLGITLGIITWSAFVMATPIADGGLILDFPIRLLTKMRMVYSEIIVWVVAISFNVYFILTKPEIYEKTQISKAFGTILKHPWPDWIIILISAIGTYVSLYFADELLDIVLFKQRKKFIKHRKYLYIIWVIFGISAFYLGYKYFLKLFGINI